VSTAAAWGDFDELVAQTGLEKWISRRWSDPQNAEDILSAGRIEFVTFLTKHYSATSPIKHKMRLAQTACRMGARRMGGAFWTRKDAKNEKPKFDDIADHSNTLASPGWKRQIQAQDDVQAVLDVCSASGKKEAVQAIRLMFVGATQAAAAKQVGLGTTEMANIMSSIRQRFAEEGFAESNQKAFKVSTKKGMDNGKRKRGETAKTQAVTGVLGGYGETI
jgi:hypothetical protein